ncbi:MAG: pyridoxamine 5'-phosphate oxidase family protein [Patescibacteria group bacterium]|nr:pyridoxamine 5'-phosphate oxidase family protein [Patescibacteria group bacterium]MDE1966378.1 pyridoxamine 5'-phosphate oxidase family protein [Patescibacteria group bacterium]
MTGVSDRELICAYIRSRGECVLATTDGSGNPEAATIEFVMDADGSIIFDTSTKYRKYGNLLRNPHVAIALGSEAENKGAQYEGIAQELVGAELDAAKKTYFAANPDAKKWEALPETAYFRVTPTFMRLRDYANEERQEIEWTKARD